MSPGDLKVVGGCLCGKVRYSSDQAPLRTAVCHCKNCQKQSGSAFSINLAIAPESLRMNGELTDYVDRSDRETAVVRRFCGTCGSPIVSIIPDRPNIVFVKAGTLDDSRGLAPDMNIFCRSAQSWIDIDTRLPVFESGPA